MTLSQIAITVALSFAIPKSTELSAPKQVDLAFSFSRAVYEQSQTFCFSDGYQSAPRLDDGRLLGELPAENVAPAADANKAKGLTLAFGFSRDCLSQMPVRRRMDEDKLLADLAARTRLIDAELTHCEEPIPTPPMAGVIKCECTPGATVVVSAEDEYEEISADDENWQIGCCVVWRRHKTPADLKARSEKMESKVFASFPQRLQVCSKPTLVEEQIEDGFPGTGHGLPRRFLISPHSVRVSYLIHYHQFPGVKDTSPLDVFDVVVRPVAASPSASDSAPAQGPMKPTLIEQLISKGFPTGDPDFWRRIEAEYQRSTSPARYINAELTLSEPPPEHEYAAVDGAAMRFADEGAAHPIYR